MKAFVVDKYKKKGPIRLADMPEPQVGANDLLIRIHATAINLLDSKIRDGEFKLFLPYKPPFILGHDLAGTVERVGANVRGFKAGDQVYARPRDHRTGTFAEMIAVDQADVAMKPASLTMEEAASIPLVGLTAWQALVEGRPRQARPQGVHSGRLWRRWHLCHPAGQASGGNGCDNDQCGKYRTGPQPWGGCGDRLQDAGL